MNPRIESAVTREICGTDQKQFSEFDSGRRYSQNNLRASCSPGYWRIARSRIIWLLLLAFSFTVAFASIGRAATARPRLLVLTDIGGDPDDQQSMVRLLVHANEFDLEGLVASASGTPGELNESVTKPHLIGEQIEAYAKVLPNLSKHASGFPSAESLRAVLKSGNPNRGRDFIGEGHDTEGSRWIIACADRTDPRPLNVTIWGGQTDLAQALWRVQKDRGTGDFQEFQSRLRVFDISDQDKVQDWLFAEFPDVSYILSKSPKGTDKRQGAYRGMYLGGDEALTSLAWLDEHVRRDHGPLGALYPPKTWTAPNPNGALKEGDTPSWFFFYQNGLGDATHPEWGGWGGRYAKESRGLFRDAKETAGGTTNARLGVSRWRPAFQNEFVARMDWCVADDFRKANHPPVAALNGDKTREALVMLAEPGGTVTLSSVGSTDPDGSSLTSHWFIYREAGANTEGAQLSAETGESVRLTFPKDQRSGTAHVILAVTDNGTPSLTRYRRGVVEVRP